MKKVTILLIAFFAIVFCANAQTVFFSENFDSSNAIPSGWTTVDADGDGFCWKIGTAPSVSGLNGSNCIYSESYSLDADILTPDNWLISPAIILPSDATLKYYAAAQDADYPSEHYGVYISTTGTNTTDFILLFDETMDANGGSAGPNGAKAQGTWKQKTIDLSAYAGETVYIAFRHFDCSDWFYLNIDEIEIETSTIQSCYAVSNIIATASGNSLAISWDASLSNPSQYQVVVSETALTDPSNETPVIVTTTSYEATGLNGNTNYYVYVRSDCGAGDYSFWSSKILKTSCSVFSIPFLETFEYDSPSFDCWTTVDADGDGYCWNNYLLNAQGLNGSNCICSESYSNSVGVLTPDNWLISPAINLTSAALLKYYAVAQDENYPSEHYAVYISTTGTNTTDFTLLFEETIDANGGSDGPNGAKQGTWKQKTINLSAYAGETVYIAFRHFNCSDWFVLNIDEVEIEPTFSIYTVSGTVTDGTNPLADVTITYNDATTTTAANGTYNFTAIENTTYTVTASKFGYTFAPASETVEVTNANVTGVDFVGTSIPTYTVSGTVLDNENNPLADVTIAYNDATTTTEADGTYSFEVEENTTHTVTPSLAGYTFAPATTTVNVVDADVTGVDFVGTAIPTYTVSGTVTDGTNPIANVEITYNDGTTTTAADGTYSFTTYENTTHTVTPNLAGYTFAPANLTVNVVDADVTGQDFVGTAFFSDIEVAFYSNFPDQGGEVITEISIATTDDLPLYMAFRNNGPNQTNEPVIFTCTINGTTDIFEAMSVDINDLEINTWDAFSDNGNAVILTANDLDIIDLYLNAGNPFTLHFTMEYPYDPNTANNTAILTVTRTTPQAPTTYTVSGTVKDTENNPIAGVTIAYNGGSTTTAANGTYNFTAEENTTHTVTATKAGYTFEPASITVNVVDANVTGQDFVGTAEGGQVAINENTANTFSVYPNPSNGLVNVVSNEAGEINVFDVAGKLVYTTNANAGETTRFELTAGMYVVKQNGNIAKIVIE